MALLGALTLVGSLLGQSLLEHFLAQGRRALGLLLNITLQLSQLLLLLLIELVGLSAEEFSFQIGNDRLSLDQLLRLQRELFLDLHQFLAGLSQGLLLERQFLLGLRQLSLEPSGILQQPGRVMGKLLYSFELIRGASSGLKCGETGLMVEIVRGQSGVVVW
jgi:hypothetical protein